MKIKKLVLGLSVLLLTAEATAHSRWILPSHFNLSNDNGEWVVLDVTASNETFNVDKPLGAEDLKVLSPKGKPLFPSSSYRGHRKSVVELHLEDSGTYQLNMTGKTSYWTSYKVKDKKGQQWLRKTNKAQRKNKLPKDAFDINTVEGAVSVLTFITLNSPSDNFKAFNKGLELVPITHPSDIAQNEEAKFSFIFNGKVQAGVEVEIIKEGVRYRNDPQAINLTTDNNGTVSFTPAQAGRYLLKAEFKEDVNDYALADTVGGRLFLTFEAVLD